MLKKGDKGSEVRALQERLARVCKLAVDGIFGDDTDTVVRALQKSAGLVVDGKYGPKTAAALDEMLKEVPGAEKPEPYVPPPAPPKVESKFDAEGWYFGARKFPIHPRRMGGEIEPCGVVDHTTDMMPGTMPALLKRWRNEQSNGAGAHFVLGRRAPTAAELMSEEFPSCGLVQLTPIYRNGNHAGGNPSHGWVLYPREGKSPQQVHPNLVYIGIEIDCAGKLVKSGQAFIHTATGKVIPREDVFIDERGKPWHRVTEYQFEQLAQLHDEIEKVLKPFPAGTTVRPNGSYQLNGVSWGALPGVRFVGHVTLDPIRKTDPGPQVIAWLRERYPNG